MEIVVLGSGGAFRLPSLSCHCERCEAARRDSRERRTTTSLWLQTPAASLLLDAGPDLYQQALREGIEKLDGIFITHAHRDHLLGVECLETLVRYGQAGRPIPIFGPVEVANEISSQFGYLERAERIQVQVLPPGEVVTIADLQVTAFTVCHYSLTTYGYRVEQDGAALVYLPDVKALDEGSGPLAAAPLPPALAGADLFFIDATFDETTATGPGHITWQEAAALGARSNAGRTVLLHISHRVDINVLRRATNERLLEGFDGQRFTL